MAPRNVPTRMCQFLLEETIPFFIIRILIFSSKLNKATLILLCHIHSIREILVTVYIRRLQSGTKCRTTTSPWSRHPGLVQLHCEYLQGYRCNNLCVACFGVIFPGNQRFHCSVLFYLANGRIGLCWSGLEKAGDFICMNVGCKQSCSIIFQGPEESLITRRLSGQPFAFFSFDFNFCIH